MPAFSAVTVVLDSKECILNECGYIGFWSSVRRGGRVAPDTRSGSGARGPPPKHAYSYMNKDNPKKSYNEPQPYSYKIEIHCITFWDFLYSYICMFRGVRHFHPVYQVQHFHTA